MEKESRYEVTNSKLFSSKHKPLDHVIYFISEKLPRLGWGQSQEKEVVLDVGCGLGVNTFQLLLPLFLQAEKIFAIDILTNLIELARTHNSHPLIEYSVADIENWSMVEKWKDRISKLTSIHCVHWLKDKRQGFQNMFELLKPGGEAAFSFIVIAPLYSVTLMLEKSPKWSKFFKDVNFFSDDHNNMYGSSGYRELLEEIGFHILYFEEQEISKQFPSDEDCRDFFTSICALTPHVPSHQREEFKDDLFQEMLKRNGRDSSGRPLHIIEMVALQRNTN